jgi:hypothetical protein
MRNGNRIHDPSLRELLPFSSVSQVVPLLANVLIVYSAKGA